MSLLPLIISSNTCKTVCENGFNYCLKAYKQQNLVATSTSSIQTVVSTIATHASKKETHLLRNVWVQF